MEPYYADEGVTLHHGDALAVLRTLPSDSMNSCVTSPPYFGLRDYGEAGQYGLEASLAEYVETMRALFSEVRRVLADDGTLWLNLGDCYAQSTIKNSNRPNANRDGSRDNTSEAIGAALAHTPRRQNSGLPPKNLLGTPWRVAFALQDDGWILRNAVVWHKPNAMPESVTDRLSSRYEMTFLFSKSQRYWFDLDPIREPLIYPDTADPRGRNPGDVWTITTKPFSEAHFAVMPPELAERCVLAGCKPGGTVLDPFSGSGTTGLVAQRHGRKYVGIDLSKDYLDLSLRTRLQQAVLDFAPTLAGPYTEETE